MTSGRNVRRVLAGTLSLALVACTVEERRTAGDSATAVAADRASGTRLAGDERSTWMARRDGARILVDETARFGDDGTAIRRFEYDSSGTLRAATEERAQTMQFGDRSPARQTVRLTLRVVATGDSATKQVDGASSPVRPYEIDNLRRHADALIALVMQRPAPTPTPDTNR